VHVDKRYRIAEVDDNGGAGANVSYQLLREAPIVPYLVQACPKLELALPASLGAAPAFRIGMKSVAMRGRHQLRWSPHALSNSAEVRSTVNCGQATASSNGFVGASDPNSPTIIDWG
jgi:hypothetical protein